jgi:hypothetical protein
MRFARGHRRAPAKNWATIPFWSLTLPSWATVQPARSHWTGEPELARWTCPTCGAVVRGIGAVARHVDSHRMQDAGDPRCVPLVPSGARG